MNTEEIKELVADAFEAGWEQGQNYLIEDAELRAERVPVGPKGMTACLKDYVEDVMYDIDPPKEK